MKKLIVVALSSLFITPSATALITTYHPGYSYNQLFTKGSQYRLNNPYNKNNPKNAYSVFNQPYNKKSLWQNSRTYGTKVVNPQGKPVGIIWKQFNYGDKKILTNPYNQVGNRQNRYQITQDYNKNRNPYPYNKFNYIYEKTSVYNNPKYATKIITNQGKPGGVIQFKTYNNKYSTFNTYTPAGNHFESPIKNGFNNQPLTKR